MIWQNINSSRNKEDSEQRWLETLVPPIYKDGDTADYSSCRRISQLSTSYTIFSGVPLPVLNSQVDKLLRIVSVDFEVFKEAASNILHSSDKGEYMGVKWNSTSAVILQGSLLLTINLLAQHSNSIAAGLPMKLVTLIQMF
jgi:hypothetical protein